MSAGEAGTMRETMDPDGFRWIGKKRRPIESRRFLLGQGQYVADVAMNGLKHLAVAKSPYPHARITAIDASAALALPGVIGVITGRELSEAVKPLRQYIEVPGVRWFPLAVEETRYAGEWVAAVVAEDRYIAEDALDLLDVTYERLPFVLDPEVAMSPESPRVHPEQPSNVLWQRKFTWGNVDEDFAQAAHRVTGRYRWHRSSAVPIETFGVVARWNGAIDLLDVWASIQMPQYPEQIANALGLAHNQVRVHYDIDVGGSYGTKRGIKHSVLTAYAARRFGVPVRFIEDRLDNMQGSDMHGPDRIFEVEAACNRDGVVQSLRMRTIDDEGAYPGRSTLQMGKPVGAIVGAYGIKSVEYEAIAVSTNKTGQVAVRGFGQAPTNFAIEMIMEAVARRVGLDILEIRRRNFIPPDAFPYRIPSGTTYDSGDYPAVLGQVTHQANWDALKQWQARARQEGRLVGIGLATCIEPGGGNALFEALFNPHNQKTTFPEGCFVKVDASGGITVQIPCASAGQSHETLVSTIVAEELERDPEGIRVIHADSLSGLPSQSPVASRMAIVLGGAASAAARKIRDKMKAIAAYRLDVPPERIGWANGDAYVLDDPERQVPWSTLADIAHRKDHLMPPGMEPGLQALHVLQVPTGGRLPEADGTVHMYPCYSFSAHIPVVEVDRHTGRVQILSYFVAHDCGTVINPDVVRGMVMGGIAHGIGAALYERFVYGEDGQLLTQSLMDYLLPTSSEVPNVELSEYVTPSPFTVFGQKGVGEGGYMSAPAAVVSAVNDALVPFGVTFQHVPITPEDILTVLPNQGSGEGQAVALQEGNRSCQP